ncbi:MAG: 1-acyl-sn-glycerol-3-phosphate acyltransferase [Opitutae bacterium]|nr:1-acyl-sn-glycerol-3-phosphate acyltransferase [Opitutae bacterium]
MPLLYGFSQHAMALAHEVAFRGEVLGQENIPAQGPFLLAANHASHLDPPIVGGHVPRYIAAFARKTLWKPGFAAWWLNTVGCIPVDRDGGSDVTALKRVMQTLKSGMPVVLFPEGTRSPTGEMQPAKPGVGMIACRTQVPVVPARIFRSHEAFGRGGAVRLGVPVSVIYGRPMAPRDYDDPKAGAERYQLAADRIMAAIARLELPTALVV